MINDLNYSGETTLTTSAINDLKEMLIECNLTHLFSILCGNLCTEFFFYFLKLKLFYL